MNRQVEHVASLAGDMLQFFCRLIVHELFLMQFFANIYLHFSVPCIGKWSTWPVPQVTCCSSTAVLLWTSSI